MTRPVRPTSPPTFPPPPPPPPPPPLPMFPPPPPLPMFPPPPSSSTDLHRSAVPRNSALLSVDRRRRRTRETRRQTRRRMRRIVCRVPERIVPQIVSVNSYDHKLQIDFRGTRFNVVTFCISDMEDTCTRYSIRILVTVKFTSAHPQPHARHCEKECIHIYIV